MIIRSILHFCLQYDHVLSVLRLEWISGHDMQGLHSSSRQLLGLIRTLNVRHLLLDMNTVPDLSPADQVWLGDHWMPELVTLTLEPLVLVIDSFRVHNQLAIYALHDLVQPGIRVDVQYFTDSESALHWLAEGLSRLPALHTEWNARHGEALHLAH